MIAQAHSRQERVVRGSESERAAGGPGKVEARIIPFHFGKTGDVPREEVFGSRLCIEPQACGVLSAGKLRDGGGDAAHEYGRTEPDVGLQPGLMVAKHQIHRHPRDYSKVIPADGVRRRAGRKRGPADHGPGRRDRHRRQLLFDVRRHVVGLGFEAEPSGLRKVIAQLKPDEGGRIIGTRF